MKEIRNASNVFVRESQQNIHGNWVYAKARWHYNISRTNEI
jgi:hypothetical protein